MKKILYISNYKKGVGGISSQVSLLKDCLDNDGMSRADALNEPHCVLNDAFQADIFSTKGNPVKRIGVLFKLLWVARKYDVLHIHGCSEWGMLPVVYGVIAGKIWKKRIIVTYHGGEAAEYFAKHGAFVRRWLMRSDQVIVLNGYLKKVFDEYRIPSVVIPNIVPLREDIYQPKKTIAPKMISVRHLNELYRIDVVIRAFAKVVEKYPEATLDVLGQGDKREELENLVSQLRVKSEEVRGFKVRFIGQVPNEKMYDYLKANDIMLSAPRIDNMPVSLMEAMNAGVLVISSKVGGVPYMIEHKKNGLLFEVRGKREEVRGKSDEDALAEQILWALEHQKESVAMIEAAHEEVKKYTWEKVKLQLLPMYE